MKDIRRMIFDRCLIYVLCHARRYDLAIVCTSLEKCVPVSGGKKIIIEKDCYYNELEAQGAQIIDPEDKSKKSKQYNHLHSLLDPNLRYSIYNVIEFEYQEFNHNNLKLFSDKLNIDVDTISNLLICSNPFLNKDDFTKICTYLDPNLYIMACWQEMYTEI